MALCTLTPLVVDHSPSKIMATEIAARKFFSASKFAVVGASSNPAKFGHKVHAWYLHHGLPVTPINPSAPTVSVDGADHSTVSTVGGLPSPKETAVSIITPPPVTLQVLKEAKNVGIPAVWLQPGTFNEDVLDFALADGNFEAVVYGEGGRGGEGWCVLVDGEAAMQGAGKL
ncbi:CoA binding domain-containing protein [Stachybotrys elegans]|uniref:CoA binding domain-containing protein n=1 Tax=Stachybotrys elegans TaxID=80388 RepID=A0A8K0SW34_9HYPO|nr:CoA binding domain-containing protein [Stachybotrys elegans]